MNKEYHNIPPLYDRRSAILILGSFPSVKSREGRFFYNHPQNRFWKVVSSVFNAPCPLTVEEKKRMLLKNRVAVWDVIQSCEIKGSSDGSIKNVRPNDLGIILSAAPIKRIFCNGSKTYELYQKYCEAALGRRAVKLPSTSPANAAYSEKALAEAWREILNAGG